MAIEDIQTHHVLHSEGGKFTDKTSSRPEDVDRILDRAAAQAPPAGLVLHFHGGLNSQKVGREIADRLAPEYGAAGAYPVFFVWESGLLETLGNNLKEIARDKPFQELVKKACEWVLKKAGGGLAAREAGGLDEAALRADLDRWFQGRRRRPPLPEPGVGARGVLRGRGAALPDEQALAQEIAEGLDDDPAFRKAFEDLPAATGRARSARERLAPKVRDRLVPGPAGPQARGVVAWLSVARFVAKLVVAVLKRYKGQRDHGLYCTVVEEVLRSAYVDLAGSTVWINMKRDTADSFGTDPSCCGTRVVGGLAARSGKFGKITLVGHSTGAVYICEFLDAAAAAMPDQAFDVVFLAPAATHERFAAALERHRGRIGHFRQFAMTDELECEDVLVPIAYPRSLLYFVSGLLEGAEAGGKWKPEVDAPVLGMKRYLAPAGPFGAGFPAVAAVRRYFGDDERRAVWSVSEAGEGLTSHARKHGDFDNDPATVESVKTILRQGF